MVEVLGRGAKALWNARDGRNRESGQVASEYVVLIGIFAVLLIIAIVAVRVGVTGTFDRGSAEVGTFQPPAQALCDQHYSGGCLPPYPPGIDCDYLEAHGMAQVTVQDSDPHGLDPDGNGIACD